MAPVGQGKRAKFAPWVQGGAALLPRGFAGGGGRPARSGFQAWDAEGRSASHPFFADQGRRDAGRQAAEEVAARGIPRGLVMPRIDKSDDAGRTVAHGVLLGGADVAMDCAAATAEPHDSAVAIKISKRCDV
jgi:hypothetical protein